MQIKTNKTASVDWKCTASVKIVRFLLSQQMLWMTHCGILWPFISHKRKYEQKGFTLGSVSWGKISSVVKICDIVLSELFILFIYDPMWGPCAPSAVKKIKKTFLKAGWLCIFLADGWPFFFFFVILFQVVWQKMSEPLVHVASRDSGPKCLV